jgi:formaldehyde-activating enzyme involved in methanogenesis
VVPPRPLVGPVAAVVAGMNPALRAARRRLPTAHLKPGIRAQLTAGMSPEAIARAVADAVDGLIAFDRIVPGPVGVVAELLDGPVIYAAALVLVCEVRRAMERRAAGR